MSDAPANLHADARQYHGDAFGPRCRAPHRAPAGLGPAGLPSLSLYGISRRVALTLAEGWWHAELEPPASHFCAASRDPAKAADTLMAQVEKANAR